MKENTHKSTPERVIAFSDGVFAIIITIMILELKRPAAPTFAALFAEWPTWVSYIVSYVFIAIVWIQHHFLMRHAAVATLRLMWTNFAHLFSTSLIPFLTDWMADTRLAPVPVMCYAFAFLMVNVTYLALIWQTISAHKKMGLADNGHRLFHLRSISTLVIFLSAMIVAFWYPYVGFGLICLSLLFYLRPDTSGMRINK
ncbi:MAG TPA: TMEM175 family protein [Mucilaginibacter sp.]